MNIENYKKIYNLFEYSNNIFIFFSVYFKMENIFHGETFGNLNNENV